VGDRNNPEGGSVKRISVFITLLVALTVAVTGATAAPVPSVVYNAIPGSLPPNMASLGFQATQTAEFGDYVHLGGTDRNLKTVTVTMSDWALNSDYPSMPSTGWSHPITLNIYNAVPATPLNKVGPLLGTLTQTFTIPWRPAADLTCTGGTAWRAGDGQCYNGLAFNITFDLSSLNLSLPNDVIIGVAYNTQSYGVAPIGVAGPYNSLNVGVEGLATVGIDQSTDRVFWNTSTAGWYTDGGAGGVGIFREDTAWTPFGTVSIQITASAPLVGPPTSKDQCKNGGWKTFNNPPFKNQGDCVRFVSSHEGDDSNDEGGQHDGGQHDGGQHGEH
jgi:hypothetical protein